MTSGDDCKFLLSCLMNSVGKIDFEAVARETGYTNPRSASNRLAAIKKSNAAAITTSLNHNPTAPTSAAVRDTEIAKRKALPRKGRNTLKRAVEETSDSANESEGKGVGIKTKVAKMDKEAR